jgi:hypothetical protein
MESNPETLSIEISKYVLGYRKRPKCVDLYINVSKNIKEETIMHSVA